MKKFFNIIGAAFVILIACGWVANDTLRTPGMYGENVGIVTYAYRRLTVEDYDLAVRCSQDIERSARILARVVIFGNYFDEKGLISQELEDRINKNIKDAGGLSFFIYDAYKSKGYDHIECVKAFQRISYDKIHDSDFCKRIEREAKKAGLAYIDDIEQDMNDLIEKIIISS